MLRTALLALLAFAPAASAIPIVHFCFGGTYYQYSPSQDKAVVMGTCGRRPWIYVGESDVLLHATPVTTAPDTINRFGNAKPSREIPMAEFQAMLSRATTLDRIRPVMDGGPQAAALARRYPNPECKEGEYPPCHGECWGMPPGLCNIVHKIPGPVLSVKSNWSLKSNTGTQGRSGQLQQLGPGGPGPRTPCPPGKTWNGTSCVDTSTKPH
jgi:hypothetical protein